MKQLLPQDLVWETGITIYNDFFPQDVHDALAEAVLSQSERKVVVDTLSGECFPEPFHTAAQFVVDHTPIEAVNTLIAKRYEVDGPSAAFDSHYDPEEFNGWLVLCSLGGLATLTVLDLNAGQLELKCEVNTAVVLPAYGLPKLHKVSMPDPEQGARPFVFFGHRSHD